MKKFVLLSLLLLMMSSLSSNVFANSKVVEDQDIEITISEEVNDIIFGDGSGSILGNEFNTRGITKDTYIYANMASGGIGDTTYEHYGNYKYDGRAYFKNTGSRTLRIKTYTATGYLVHDFNLEPGKDIICYFTQSVLKWELADGRGTVGIQTYDGGDGVAYFRYNVVDAI